MVDRGGAAGRPPAGAAEALETGVPNLDRVLGGGILRGSIVMVIGAPGTGKTTLVQQIAFRRAARGEGALFLTAFSETHDKLLAHSHGLSFFDPRLIGEQIQIVSLPDLLRNGVDETEQAIVATARARRAALVILDGFRGMRTYLGDDQATARFLYSLGAKLALIGATTIVTSAGDLDARLGEAELTVCDVLLALRREQHGGRHRRLLDVMKVRGAASLDGMHPFTIDAAGLAVYPRLESLAPPPASAWTGQRAAFGIAEIDALLHGGLTVGSAALTAGTAGAGKTLLGLQFAAEGARLGEPALFLTFRETAAQLRERARAFDMDPAASEAAGRIRLLDLPGYDLEADRVADLLREDVERRGVRRLVIDSAADLERGIAEERKTEFLAALKSYLRGRGVTSYLSLDVPKGVGPELDLSHTPLAALCENVLLLREVEYLGQPHKVISVVRMRFSGHDRAIRAFEVEPGHGIQMVGRALPAAPLPPATGGSEPAAGTGG